MRFEKAQLDSRIRNWKERLLNDSELFKWLRGHSAPASNNVWDDEDAASRFVSSDATEVLQILASFWDRIWSRSQVGEVDFGQYLRQHGSAFEEQSWPPVLADDLLSCCRKQRRKAAGLDGWHASELLLFPHDFWVLL